MFSWMKQYNAANPKTKYFILTLVVYIVAILWTTVQAFARLDYSRTSFQVVPNNESSAKK